MNAMNEPPQRPQRGTRRSVWQPSSAFIAHRLFPHERNSSVSVCVTAPTARVLAFLLAFLPCMAFMAFLAFMALQRK
jgi:hypothetical protein